MAAPYKTRDLTNDIKGYLENDAPFNNEDDVQEYIMDCIDNALIYTSEVREFAEAYDALPEDDELISNFIEELISDVLIAIDADEYIAEEEEDEEDEE